MRTKISFIHIVIIGFWPERALLQNLGNYHGAGKSTGSVTENYLRRRQRHSELRSNDIVLIQEHKQFEIVVSGIPSPGA